MIMKIARKTNAGDDPLALAALYRAGLGSKWETMTEAAVAMAAVGVRASKNRIVQAVAVSEFPTEILALFASVGMVNRTARELIRARNEQGIADMVARSASLNPAGKSRSEILAHVCNTRSTSGYRRTYTGEIPLALNERYVQGCRSGLWSTVRQAADAMGISHSRLTMASAIAALPQELLNALPTGGLTFETGRALVDLVALRGEKVICEEAISLQNIVPRLSPQRLLNRLVGIDCSPFQAKVRRGKKKNGRSGGLFVELHLDPSDPESESRLEILVGLLNVEFGSRSVKAGSGVVVPKEDHLRPYLAQQQQRLNRPAPLSRLSVPPDLSGSAGTNRDTSVPPAGIDDDRAALDRWLSDYTSPATRNRYQNELERLLLWALLAKGKPLSSIDVNDANEYINRFTLDPQPSSMWVMRGRRPRDEPTWRPFRGPLSDESRQKALHIVKKCFNDLILYRYLVANPFQNVKVDHRPDVRLENEYTELHERSRA
ncbi:MULTISPECIES: hypothetical protein [Paraburkholderia]|nr:hypothetical protein [Paraburkholderia podalyriae]